MCIRDRDEQAVAFLITAGAHAGVGLAGREGGEHRAGALRGWDEGAGADAGAAGDLSLIHISEPTRPY